MDGKLTLSIRPEVIKHAKTWARQTGTSISAAVEQFLENCYIAEIKKETSLDRIKKLTKNAPPPISDAEYAKRKHDYLMKKYGS